MASSSLVAIMVGFTVEAVLTVFLWGVVGAVVGLAAGVVGAIAKRGPAGDVAFPYGRALYVGGFLAVTLATSYSTWLAYHNMLWRFAAMMLMYYARVIGIVPGLVIGYRWVRRRFSK